MVNGPSVGWHLLAADKVCEELSCDQKKGLSEKEASIRLQKFGKNELAHAPQRPSWKKFLDQFKSLLTAILLGAGLLAWAIGDAKDSIIILIVTLFNATLGFYQERRAEKTLEALKNMLPRQARARRAEGVLSLSAEKLVPGDIALLEAGDKVPADGRLLQAHNLEVAEAALTGESHPVSKSAPALTEKDLPLGELSNMLFMNTVVTRGRAEMVVTETGQKTQMGKIAGMLAEAPESSTPLQKQLDHLGKRLAIIAGLVAVLVFAIDFFLGLPLVPATMKAVALTVAAVPEGLPAVVTVTLAMGMWRMARSKAIVKKLSSVETLGSTTVICSDKTGTLTKNQMSVERAFYGGKEISINDIDGAKAEYREFLSPMALTSEASVRHGLAQGDPTETALLNLAMKGGIDPDSERESRPRLAEIPFDSVHKFMATFHHQGQHVVMFIKGAPDVLLGHSKNTNREELEDKSVEYAKNGLRVMAVASRTIPTEDFSPSEDLWKWVGDWSFLGMAGIIDPARPEAVSAIAACKAAGIQVKMITGDHKITAATIAKQLGLEGEVILGEEINALSDEELIKRSDKIAVFARVSPDHKVRIVKALQANGHVTAMTGDGVNDAPALKTADIGVAMGLSGTEVTKEAAKLILTDDNFATIVKAVKEGRVIYDNIVKFVRFQLSTNIGAILTVLGASLAGLPSPFTPVQLLWINIIMDGPPAMSLGLEKARKGLMQERPRSKKERVLNSKRLAALIYYGLIMTTGSLGTFIYGLTSGDKTYAVTLAFSTFVFFQFFNVFNARAEKTSAFDRQFFQNSKLWGSLFLVAVLQILVVYWPPAQSVFSTTSIAPKDWFIILPVASSVLVLEEIRKLVFMKNESKKNGGG